MLDKFEGALHGEGNALAGLEDHGVAGGDSVRKKPEGNHGREIESGDGGDDAERLANHDFVNAAGDVFEVITLHHHGNAAGDFDVFDSAAEFGFGFGESFAVFDGYKSAEFVDMLFKEHFEFEERLDAVLGRSAAPVREGGGSGFDGGIDFCGVGQRHFAERGVIGGIDEILPIGGFGGDPFTGDEMGDANFGYGGGAHGNTSAFLKSWWFRIARRRGVLRYA